MPALNIAARSVRRLTMTSSWLRPVFVPLLPKTQTGRWRDYWLATGERKDPDSVRIGAVTDQPDTFLTAIANGCGVALVPESAAR